jgi:RES domain-containing protein
MNLVTELAQCELTVVAGTFMRHTSVKVRELVGSRAGGRWGPPQLFPVLYLGRPTDSVTAEAYRHLVDATEGLRGSDVGPRRLWTCHVNISDVLDLRLPGNLTRLGLTDGDLLTEPWNYLKCHQVAVAAHQLELHGIIAPSASGLGETLALFDQHLGPELYPRVVAQDIWQTLPADPRSTDVRANRSSGNER